jgi:hypothetical protein
VSSTLTSVLSRPTGEEVRSLLPWREKARMRVYFFVGNADVT